MDGDAADRVRAIVRRAADLSIAGDHDRADLLLFDARAQAPADVEVFAEAARVSFRRGQWNDAVNRWEEALTLREIAVVQACCGDLVGAKRTVAQIGQRRVEAATLHQIAVIQAANGDVVGAKRTVAQITRY